MASKIVECYFQNSIFVNFKNKFKLIKVVTYSTEYYSLI